MPGTKTVRRGQLNVSTMWAQRSYRKSCCTFKSSFIMPIDRKSRNHFESWFLKKLTFYSSVSLDNHNEVRLEFATWFLESRRWSLREPYSLKRPMPRASGLHHYVFALRDCTLSMERFAKPQTLANENLPKVIFVTRGSN